MVSTMTMVSGCLQSKPIAHAYFKNSRSRQHLPKRSSILCAQSPGGRDPSGGAQGFSGNNPEDAAPAIPQDWRAFRAKLVRQETHSDITDTTLMTPHPTGAALTSPLSSLTNDWIVPLPNPEPGALLVARHSMLAAFNWTIILLLEHNDAIGSVGLVINMPTHLPIRECGVDEHIHQAFGNEHLAIGGPVARSVLHAVHCNPDVEGAIQVLPGIYSGGVHAAAGLVCQGLADRREFHLIAGYSGWGAYQLQHEIEREDWWVVSASPSVVKSILKERQLWTPGSGGDLSTITTEERDAKLSSWQRFTEKANLPLTW